MSQQGPPQPWAGRTVISGPDLNERIHGLEQSSTIISSEVQRETICGPAAFRLRDYDLLATCSENNNSRIYRARHRATGKTVAVKILTRFPHGSSLPARFHREARLLVQLRHPHVARGLEFGHFREHEYLIMEYIQGIDLRRLVDVNGPLSFAAVAHCIYQAVLGLQYLHDVDVVHRDLKPSNLMVDIHGQIKVLDFGLARPFFEDWSGAEPLTVAFDDHLLGTVDYMAPEQALDCHNVDGRADLYSLGCTMFGLLTGTPPFPDGPLVDRLLKHANTPPPRIDRVRPDTPRILSEVCMKLLAKRPIDRFQEASEVVAALKPFVEQCGPIDLPKLELAE